MSVVVAAAAVSSGRRLSLFSFFPLHFCFLFVFIYFLNILHFTSLLQFVSTLLLQAIFSLRKIEEKKLYRGACQLYADMCIFIVVDLVVVAVAVAFVILFIYLLLFLLSLECVCVNVFNISSLICLYASFSEN